MKVKVQFRTKLEMTLNLSFPLLHLWGDLTIALTFPINERKYCTKKGNTKKRVVTALMELA